MTIDNVKLFRKGTEEDFVVNGGFEHPYLKGRPNKLYAQIPGWKGKIFEVGPGTSYNVKWWSTNQVLELDAFRNIGVSQLFNFDANYDIGKLNYALEFLWSGRTTGPKHLNSHTGLLVWNDDELEHLVPPNTDIQKAYYDVELREGYNFLQFKGTGASDAYGMVVDKLILKPPIPYTDALACRDHIQHGRIAEYGCQPGAPGHFDPFACKQLLPGHPTVFMWVTVIQQKFRIQ